MIDSLYLMWTGNLRLACFAERERMRSRMKIFETAYRSLTIVWIERKKLLNFCQQGERGDSFAIFLNEETVSLPSNCGAKCFRYNEEIDL